MSIQAVSELKEQVASLEARLQTTKSEADTAHQNVRQQVNCLILDIVTFKIKSRIIISK